MLCKFMLKKYTIRNAPKETQEKDSFEDDYVAKSMGAFGLWQLMYIAIASTTRLIPIWNTLSVIFIAPPTDFVCKNFSDNVTVEVRNNTCYENCVEYEFVRDIFEETLVTEFGLICDDAWLASFTQTVMMFGVLCGASFYGWVSDRFGRSKGIVSCGINCVIFMFAAPFSPNYWTVTALRFFIGFGSGGIFSLSAVYNSELVGAKYVHVVLGSAIPLMDTIGLPFIAFLAYMTSSWQSFTLGYAVITVLIIILTGFLPETPRWLIAKRKVNAAVDLMTRAVKFNGKDTSSIIENVAKTTEQLNLKQGKDLHLTYFDLFRTRKLAKWTIAVLFLWITAGFCYYGLMQFSSHFGSNIYIVVALLGVFHGIPCSAIAIPVLNFCRRKPTCICMYIIVGVSCVALIFTSRESTAAVVLGVVSTTAVTVLFTVIYVYVIELYPTPMRNMGLSLASVGSKGAAMVAPFAVNMKTQWAALAVFAAMSFAAALCCLLLPETKGHCLKDNIDDDK